MILKMESKTNLVKRFALKGPLILAPLSGGPSTPALVAAVSNAGGLGSLGVAYLKPEAITREIQETRQWTSKAFAVNLFVPAKVPAVDEVSIHRALKATHAYREELGIPDPVVKPPYGENFDMQFEAVISERPAALSFTFGLLEKKYLDECRKQNIFVIGTATTLEEALALQDSEVDAIVAQGVEAGGHRGIFSTEAEDPNVGIFPLVEMMFAKVKLPIIAAGGIMNGQGIAAALALGAQAAQLGTAFLTCEEAGTSKPYRQVLLSSEKKKTRLTRAFSGRWARGFENRFMQEIDTHHKEAILPFPIQNSFTRDIRNKASQTNRPEFLSLWAGEGYSLLRTMKAAELTEILLSEFEEARQVR